VNIINRMEKSIDPDTMYQILESCACTGGKKYLEQCKKIGKNIAAKTLKEKIDYLNNNSDLGEMWTLKGANTLTFMMPIKDNDRYKCVCSAAVKTGIKVSDLAFNDSNDHVMPLSYCFCCAGSIRLHAQLKLGIELKSKTIVSSPINSKGKKPCEIIFKII